MCPAFPNWECPQYHNSWWPNATRDGAKIFPYADVLAYQAAARSNQSGDPVPYVPNVIAGFDPRPWEEHGPSFALPTRAEWEAALREVRALVTDPTNAVFGFPDATAPAGVAPAVTIYAWNEFGEGGVLAPTVGAGSMLLDVVADVFGQRRAAGGASEGVPMVHVPRNDAGR